MKRLCENELSRSFQQKTQSDTSVNIEIKLDYKLLRRRRKGEQGSFVLKGNKINYRAREGRKVGLFSHLHF